MKHLFSIAAIAAVFAAFTTPASAHITLENGMSSWGAYYKAVFRVPHGCDGAATTGVTVDIPEGVISVKPMPKPGWKITTVAGPYAHTYTSHGKPVSEGVKNVDWSGGSLPDDQFDEFVFLAKLPDDKEIMRIYFPVTQTCGATVVRWNQIAKPDQNVHELKNPAPSVDLMAAHDGMEGMQH
ncbi:MAG: YcnI family protein [Parvibaculum sp.]|uniref:YcnI family copper-binding membrane protein n=1 Tax=Parvibaculum sp. TaxID=2024848 RepID=UPI0025D3A26A|nr:YcnI family protein [Parvibaculum sp.]MCE9649330.1 YcnI family protein [Parvibaculum sp.]